MSPPTNDRRCLAHRPRHRCARDASSRRARRPLAGAHRRPRRRRHAAVPQPRPRSSFTRARRARVHRRRDRHRLIHPDDFEGLGSNFDSSSERPGEPIPVRYRTRHADGSWRIIEGTYTNLLDDPDIAGIVLDVNDVTERANAEAALRASEARNRRVIDSLAEGILLSGEGGQIVDCNPAALELLGVTADEIASTPRRPALEPDRIATGRRSLPKTGRRPRRGRPVNRAATS